MDLLSLLQSFVPGARAVTEAAKPEAKPNAQGLYMRPPWEGNFQIQDGPRYEDERVVFTPQGPQMLDTLMPGQPWSLPQQRQPQQPQGIQGATNPLLQILSGRTPYSPGEGPRTNHNRRNNPNLPQF